MCGSKDDSFSSAIPNVGQENSFMCQGHFPPPQQQHWLTWLFQYNSLFWITGASTSSLVCQDVQDLKCSWGSEMEIKRLPSAFMQLFKRQAVFSSVSGPQDQGFQRNQTHPLTYLFHTKLGLGGQALRTNSQSTAACFVLVLVVGKMHMLSSLHVSTSECHCSECGPLVSWKIKTIFFFLMINLR